MKKCFGFTGMAFLLIFLAQCKKDSSPFPDAPQITLDTIYPLVATEFIDSVWMVIKYQDGNSNLGFVQSDSFSLFVKDSRLPAYDTFYVPPLAPIGANVPIFGTLTIPYGTVYLLGNDTSETTYFQIKIRDRNGNWSNILQTPTITIIE